MRYILAVCAVATLVACSDDETKTDASAPEGAPSASAEIEAPAGVYKLDKYHASLIFRVNHLGFSNYTARFTRFDADLQFDPDNPESMSVVATIDPTSIETDYPESDELDFNKELQGAEWLNAAKFPQISFRSTKIERTGPNTARVTGDLELLGVTQPVVLDTTFNGGYAGHPMDPNARIGFSAQGTLMRSAYGMTYGIPEEGSTMGVGDQVEIIIETEFNGPPLPGAEAPEGH
jgi:polyisoprenoid-binding protein YceI